MSKVDRNEMSRLLVGVILTRDEVLHNSHIDFKGREVLELEFAKILDEMEHLGYVFYKTDMVTDAYRKRRDETRDRIRIIEQAKKYTAAIAKKKNLAD